MILQKTKERLNPNPYWNNSIEVDYIDHKNCMQYFDQNGYDLTPLEQLYAAANLQETSQMRWRTVLYKKWYTQIQGNKIHLNHACLYERKTYIGKAHEQLKQLAQKNPLIYKLIHMKPKWGIDISIDFIDAEKAYEVFHYEWDDFDYSRVIAKQIEIEQIIENTNWEEFAKFIWDNKEKWTHLDFEGQSKFKTDALGLSPERFKLVMWHS